MMQNICVFICLLKDVEGILSVHRVVSGASTKSEHRLWIKINPRKQEKTNHQKSFCEQKPAVKLDFLLVVPCA